MEVIDKEKKFTAKEVVELLLEIDTSTCDCPARGFCGQFDSCESALMVWLLSKK